MSKIGKAILYNVDFFLTSKYAKIAKEEDTFNHEKSRKREEMDFNPFTMKKKIMSRGFDI